MSVRLNAEKKISNINRQTYRTWSLQHARKQAIKTHLIWSYLGICSCMRVKTRSNCLEIGCSICGSFHAGTEKRKRMEQRERREREDSHFLCRSAHPCLQKEAWSAGCSRANGRGKPSIRVSSVGWWRLLCERQQEEQIVQKSRVYAGLWNNKMLSSSAHLCFKAPVGYSEDQQLHGRNVEIGNAEGECMKPIHLEQKSLRSASLSRASGFTLSWSAVQVKDTDECGFNWLIQFPKTVIRQSSR